MPLLAECYYLLCHSTGLQNSLKVAGQRFNIFGNLILTLGYLQCFDLCVYVISTHGMSVAQTCLFYRPPDDLHKI